jgi:hypothetical protein
MAEEGDVENIDPGGEGQDPQSISVQEKADVKNIVPRGLGVYPRSNLRQDRTCSRQVLEPESLDFIVQQFVEEKTENFREFFKAQAPFTWTLGDALVVTEAAYPATYMLVLGLMPSGRFIGWKNADLDWPNGFKGSVRLIAPSEEYFSGKFISGKTTFKKYQRHGRFHVSSVSDIGLDDIKGIRCLKEDSLGKLESTYKQVNLAENKKQVSCFMADSLAQLVSLYKKVYHEENTMRTEEELIVKVRGPFLQADVDNLVEKLSADLEKASFFLLGKALTKYEAKRLIRLGCGQDYFKGDEEIWNLLGKPVRELGGLSFPDPLQVPLPVDDKGAYFARGDRIYVWDASTGIFDYFWMIVLVVIPCVIGSRQPGTSWEKAYHILNLLLTGLVAVVLFLASEKDHSGERPLLSRLMLRRAISIVNEVDELHCIISILKKVANPGRYVSWPKLQLVADNGGKTFLDFDKVYLRDLGVDEVTIWSQSMYVTVLNKTYQIYAIPQNEGRVCNWYLYEEAPLGLGFLLKGVNVKLESKPY